MITGASSGNGRAAAHAFAAEGARLVLAARRREALEDVAAECRSLGAEALAVPTDVARHEQMARLAAVAVRAFGRVDIWINSAAVLHYGRLDESPAEIVEQVIQTNVIGYLNGSREALRLFRAQHHGVLINTSSILGAIGHPYTAAYVASKFAIRGLTESLREEVLDEPDVHVCAVLPAAVDTPIYQRAANYTGRRVRPIWIVHRPEDVARTMVSLARRPRRQAFAGWSAPLAVLGRGLAPALAERAVRLAADRMELARQPAPPSAGNLFAPKDDGYRVDGGWRERYGRNARPRLIGALAFAAGLGLVVSGLRARRGAARG